MAYHRPTALTDAFGLLATSDLSILAGGTDVFAMETGRELHGDVLDITAISQLGGISQTGDGWRIGANTTWSEVANAPLPDAFWALQQAAREVGSLQIQNSATVAGNLCNASPAADGVPPLLVLDASVEIGSQSGTRQIPLSDFITGVRKTALQSGEMVTAICIPSSAMLGVSAFQKLGARKYLVISICMVAVRLAIKNRVIIEAAISVGSCSPVACRMPALESAMMGQHFDDPEAWQAVLEQQVNHLLTPIDDIRADAGYRSAVAVEMINRCIQDAKAKART